MTPADLSPALVAACWILASYRLSRLVTTDTIWGEPPETHEDEMVDASGAVVTMRRRDHGTELRAMLDRRLIGDDGNPLGFWRGKFATLIGCPLCAGVWMSALVVWSWHWGEWSQWGLIVAAVAGAQGFMASRYEG